MEPGGPYRQSAKRRAAIEARLSGPVVIACTIAFTALTIGSLLLIAEVFAR